MTPALIERLKELAPSVCDPACRGRCSACPMELMMEAAAELSSLRQSEAELKEVRVELGCAGHFIAANRCRWKRHTQVGNYRISSIGDYYLGDARQTIGAGPNSYFETMVFETTGELCGGNDGCGCRVVREWDELDGERYATAGEAQAGHERYVSMYAARAALWETKK